MVSCSNCREAHTACSDERPCARCVNIGKAHSCVDAVSRKRGRRPRTALTPPAAGQQADPQQPQQQQLSLSSPTLRSPTFALPSASTFTSIVTPGGQQDSRSSFSTSPFFIAAPIPTQLSYSCSPSPLASPAGKGGGSGGTSSDGTGGSRRAPPGPALSFRPTYFGPSPSLASSALALSSASSSAANKQQGHKAKHKRTRSNPTTGGGRKEITNTEDSFDVSNDDPSTTGTKPQPEQTRHESYSSNPEEQHKVAKMVSTFEQHPPRHHNKQNDSSGEGDSLYPHHQMHLPPHPHSHTTKQHAPRPQNQHRVRQQQAQRPTPSGTMDPERERQNFVASLMLRFNAALKENSDALASRMERKVQESKREVELLREELRELKNLLLSTAASAISAGATSSSSSASSRHHHMAHDLGMDPPRSGNTSLKVSFGPSSIASSSLSSSNRRNESSYWSNHFDEMEIMGSSGTSAFSSLFSSTDREEPLSPRPLFSSTVPSFWPATPPNSDFGGAALPPISSASCPSSSSSFASSSSSSSSLPHHHSDVSTSFSSSSSQPTIDLCSFLCSSLSTCSPFLPSAGSTSSSASASFSTSSSSFSSTTSSSSDQLANMGEAFGRIPSHMQKPFLMMVHSVGVSKIVNVNDSYCKLLKINPEDLVGQPSFILRSFLPPQHRFMVDPEIIPLFERHTTFYDCYRAIILAQARDGSHLQMDSAYHTFYGVTGLPSWTILIVEGVKLLTGSIQGIPPSIVLIRPKSCNSSNSLPSISWQPQRQQEGEGDGDGEDGEGDGESSSSSSQDQRHQRQHYHGHLESILQTDLVGHNVSNPNVVSSSSSTSSISTSPVNLQQQSTSFSSSPTSSSTSSCPTSPSFVFPSQLSSMSAATSSSSSSCSSATSTSSSTSTLASATPQQQACKEGTLETDMTSLTSSSTNNDTNYNQSLPSSHSRGTRDPSSSSPSSSSSPPPSSSSSPSSSGFNHQNPQRLFFSQQHTSVTSPSIEDIINKQLRSASASISSVSSSSASFMVGGQEAGGATPPAGSCASCTTPIPNSPEPFSIFYQL